MKRSNTCQACGCFPGGKVEPDDPGEDALEQARHGAARELQEEAGVSLSPAALTPFSHWLTPVVVKRRFSTWFFLAEVDDDTPVTVDGSEITAHQWWCPSEGARRASQRRFAADAANTGLIARAAVPGGIPGRMDGFGIAATHPLLSQCCARG